VALKKPSDFFGNTKKTPLDEVQEEYSSATPEKIEQVSEAFDTFKGNLNHIQSLSDFTSTFDSFKNNLDKVESVSEEVSSIKEDIKNLIKKEDLDSAMMAHLLFVQESISKIESKISSINGETVDKIKEDFGNLSTSVENFLSIDVPQYKKLISESEVRVDDRFGTFKSQVEENLGSIKADINKEVTSVLADIESLGESTVLDAKKDFKKHTKKINETVNALVEEELPKYKKLFAETEIRTEEKIKTAIDSYQDTIESLNKTVKEFTQVEIPKYNNLLIENKIKSEKEVKQLEEEVLSKVSSLTEKVQDISGGIHEKTEEKMEDLQSIIVEYRTEIDSISKTYDSLYKDFKKREISENKKLETYSTEIKKYQSRFEFLEETVNEDLREIQSVLIQSNENYHASLKTEVGKFRDKITGQMKDLEVDLVVNEQHIKKQNENIESIQEELKVVLEKLQLSSIEEKSNSLMEKINNIEGILSNVSDTVKEKSVLKEDNPNLPGDPSTNNSDDPLTPLDQKYVTLEQLQQHYKLFVQRVQHQLSSLGGGGIEDAPNDGQIYSRKNRQWILSTGGGGKFTDDSVGIHTTSNVGLGTTARSDSTLYVDGNATITGDLNVTGDLSYDEVNARNWNITGIATVGTAFYMPQYTTAARDAATFNEGAMIYNTTIKKMEFYDGTNWVALPGMTLGLTVALDG
jgi:DNA repair exonuclease SbcCD ATPase subunit